MPLGPHVWMPKIPSLLLILARGRGVSKVLGIGSMVSSNGYLIKNALVFINNKMKSLEITQTKFLQCFLDKDDLMTDENFVLFKKKLLEMAGISNLLSKTGNFKIPVNTSGKPWTIIPIIAGLYHSCQKPVKTSLLYQFFVHTFS